jgi:hypothetical protein
MKKTATLVFVQFLNSYVLAYEECLDFIGWMPSRKNSHLPGNEKDESYKAYGLRECKVVENKEHLHSLNVISVVL